MVSFLWKWIYTFARFGCDELVVGTPIFSCFFSLRVSAWAFCASVLRFSMMHLPFVTDHHGSGTKAIRANGLTYTTFAWGACAGKWAGCLDLFLFFFFGFSALVRFLLTTTCWSRSRIWRSHRQGPGSFPGAETNVRRQASGLVCLSFYSFFQSRKNNAKTVCWMRVDFPLFFHEKRNQTETHQKTKQEKRKATLLEPQTKRENGVSYCS